MILLTLVILSSNFGFESLFNVNTCNGVPNERRTHGVHGITNFSIHSRNRGSLVFHDNMDS